MIFTFIGLSTLSLAGFQISRLFASALNAELNLWITGGAGFFIAAALLIQWLSYAPFSLSTASWSAVLLATLIAATTSDNTQTRAGSNQ